jgi:hypothetical protein
VKNYFRFGPHVIFFDDRTLRACLSAWQAIWMFVTPPVEERRIVLYRPVPHSEPMAREWHRHLVGWISEEDMAVPALAGPWEQYAAERRITERRAYVQAALERPCE